MQGIIIALTRVLISVCISAVLPNVVAMSAVQDYLASHLSSYDVIDSKLIISKRSIGMETKTVQFSAFNKTYNLVLIPALSESTESDLTVSVFETDSIPKSNSEYSKEISTGFYTGYIEGDPKSRVKGYFTGNQVLCTIYTGSGEVLSIEPMSRFSGNLFETQLLAYYDSQLRDSPTANPIACGTKEALRKAAKAPIFASKINHKSTFSSDTTWSSRLSRSTKTNRYTCSLQVVADHAFFDRIGLNQIGTTMRIVVKIIDDVNEVFFATELPDIFNKNQKLPSVGFKLSSVLIMSTPDKSPNSFNAGIDPKKTHSASELLSLFNNVDEERVNLSSHCLNHLLTYRPMQRNVLGLARVATPCSYSNIGLTSYCQSAGFPLLFRQAVLVTAHELGHNMGSMHDPESNLECMPEASKGGPYLMWARSVLGYDKNNDKFSPCSVKAIASVVQDALATCLTKSETSLCGNHRRDPGEDCDAGLVGDACCHSNCSLKSGAVCSDANSPCCNKCKLASNDTICLGESPLRPCRQPSRCTGASFDCPSTSLPAADGSICNNGAGRCLAGACESVCHPNVECPCPEQRHSCVMCCRSPGGSASQQCLPLSLNGRQVPLPVDWPCHSNGSENFRHRCQDNGTCSSSFAGGATDSVRGGTGEVADEPNGRIGSRLLHLAVMRSGCSFATNNLVFITLIVTLIIYVPVCLVLQYRENLQRQANGENTPDGDITFDVIHNTA